MKTNIRRVSIAFFVGTLASITTGLIISLDLEVLGVSLVLCLFLLIPIVSFILLEKSTPAVWPHVSFFAPLAIVLGMWIITVIEEKQRGYGEGASDLALFLLKSYAAGCIAAYIACIKTKPKITTEK